jgi:hypothetical protein
MTLLTDSEIEAIERTAGKEWSEATTFFPSIATRAIRKAEAAVLAKVVLIVEQTADDPVEQTRIIDAIRKGDV